MVLFKKIQNKIFHPSKTRRRFSALRIKCFIHEAIEPHRTELRPLLYALFVHVYLELVQNGQKVAGER